METTRKWPQPHLRSRCPALLQNCFWRAHREPMGPATPPSSRPPQPLAGGQSEGHFALCHWLRAQSPWLACAPGVAEPTKIQATPGYGTSKLKCRNERVSKQVPTHRAGETPSATVSGPAFHLDQQSVQIPPCPCKGSPPSNPSPLLQATFLPPSSPYFIQPKFKCKPPGQPKERSWINHLITNQVHPPHR